MTDAGLTRLWLRQDPSIPRRTATLIDAHRRLYGASDGRLVLTCAPGRAEILGSHTDYNGGSTISCTIPRTLLALGTRSDRGSRIASLDLGGGVVNADPADGSGGWASYVRGVVWGLREAAIDVPGFDAVVQSAVPIGAGLSSSAALELASALLVTELAGVAARAGTLIEQARRAEVEYVGVPCGYLDQATIALAREAFLVLDHGRGASGSYRGRPIPFDLARAGARLVAGFDPSTARHLGSGGYTERRRRCEEALATARRVWPQRRLRFLTDLTGADVGALEGRVSDEVLAAARHVVSEHERVVDAAARLSGGDLAGFGVAMTASGRSALDDYELDEGIPNLRWLLEMCQNNSGDWGIMGVRNMGGGFNASTVALVGADEAALFRQSLGRAYAERFGAAYHFIEFAPAPSMSLLDLSIVLGEGEA